jgi:hypothetical protein
MNPAVKSFLGLRVDISLANQTAEGGLDVGTWASETVVKVEMAEGRIKVVAPEQANHAAAKPNTLWIAGRTGQNTGSFGDFIDLFLGLFGRVSRRFLRFGRFAVAAALREGGWKRET